MISKIVAVLLSLATILSGYGLFAFTSLKSREMKAEQSSAVHSDITVTVFWVGEDASGENGNISNHSSAWDEDWVKHYGGVDSPDDRSGSMPSGFTPKENPFYIALPYNDIDETGNQKSIMPCKSFSLQPEEQQQCKNTWIEIIYRNKTVYAQWEDVGPFGEDDANYVFGIAKPVNTKSTAAGIDVSPAVRDYLGLNDVSIVDWRFVKSVDVPSGPWKSIVTTSTY